MTVPQRGVEADRKQQRRRCRPRSIDAPAQARRQPHQRNASNAGAQFWQLIDQALQRIKPAQLRQRRCCDRDEGEGAGGEGEAGGDVRRCLEQPCAPCRFRVLEFSGVSHAGVLV